VRLSFGRLYLFKIFGIPIQLDYTWFIVFILFSWWLATGIYPDLFPEWTSTAHWIAGSFSSLLLFVSVLLHELAHSWVALRSGIPIAGITLFIFGGIARISREAPDPRTELKIAVAGPLMSFLLAILFFVAAQIPLSTLAGIFLVIALLNAGLGVFNLIPGFPLDGGRVLRAILWRRRGDLRWATKIASTVGKVLAVAVMVWGFSYLFSPDSFIEGVWRIFIGLFLLQAAEAGYRQAVIRTALRGTSVGEVMSPNSITVSPLLALDVLVGDYFLKYRCSACPVVEDTRLVGMLTLADVRTVPRSAWSTTQVKDIMTPAQDIAPLDPAEDVVDVLHRMARDRVHTLPVIERGNLLGVLTQTDILEVLKVKIDLGK